MTRGLIDSLNDVDIADAASDLAQFEGSCNFYYIELVHEAAEFLTFQKVRITLFARIIVG